MMAIYKPGRPRKFTPCTERGQRPPQVPGEYRMRNQDGEITYVGETNNLLRRMKEHVKTGKLSTVADAPMSFEYMVADGRSTSHTRRIHEQAKIKEHNPILNKSIGGEGRPAKR